MLCQQVDQGALVVHRQVRRLARELLIDGFVNEDEHVLVGIGLKLAGQPVEELVELSGCQLHSSSRSRLGLADRRSCGREHLVRNREEIFILAESNMHNSEDNFLTGPAARQRQPSLKNGTCNVKVAAEVSGP